MNILRKLLWITCLDSLFIVAYSESDRCAYVAETETLKLNNYEFNELHIRHNIKGSVEIRDAPPGAQYVTAEVEKRSGTRSELHNFHITQSSHSSHGRTTLLLQLDYIPRRLSGVVIGGGVAGTVLFLAVILLLICLYHRRHQHILHGPGDGTATTSQSCSPSRISRAVCDDRPASASRSHSRDSVETPPHSMSLLRQRSLVSTDADSDDFPPPPPPDDSFRHYATMHVGGARRTLDERAMHTLPRDYRDYREPYPVHRPEPPKTYHDECGEPLPRVVGGGGGGGGGGGRGKGGYQSAMMCLTILSLTAVVYAGCVSQPTAHVLLYMPSSHAPSAVKIFFNKKYRNPDVIVRQWMLQNITQLSVYDVASAGVSGDGTCEVTDVCRNTHAQSLMACEPLSRKCICQRGFTMQDHECTDIDECQEDVCPEEAVCQNVIGSFICHCGRGFYNYAGACKACSVGCPEGTFESIPCTYDSDRVCSNAAHPVQEAGEQTIAGYMEGLKAISSANVFLENLHNTRHLETSYYVTNNKQETDFNWFRDSGIRVNIGLKELSIIPEFADVTHRGDNEFVMDNPNIVSKRDSFSNIMRSYCRYPIPDYYSITLEIARDRATSARQYTCNHDNRCPQGYQYGDDFINRTVDVPCTKLGTYPKAMPKHPNSMVCVENTELLSHVFNRTAGKVVGIKVPSRPCKDAQELCQDCQQRCTSGDEYDRKCCWIDCMSSADCKLAHSDACSHFPIECAMGEAYRFTMSPIYEDIQHSFQCHLQRKKPRVMYKLWFYVSVIANETETIFETTKLHHTVYSDQIEDASEGEFHMRFFTIKHDSGLRLEDEDFILTGRELPRFAESDSELKWNYMLHHMKQPGDYGKGNFGSYTESSRLQQVSVQFNEPFGYSSSNWHSDNFCHKNVSKFVAPQGHTKGGGQAVTTTFDTTGSAYHYVMRSKVNSAKVTFLIQSNISVLDWWFTDKEGELLIDDSLKCRLNLSADGRIWDISISGTMTVCPGYVNIIINDRGELEELFRYDLLVACPPTFNVSFKIPNWGLMEDKTFDIVFNDTKKVHRAYLTYLGNRNNEVPLENGVDILPAESVIGLAQDDLHIFYWLIVILVLILVIFVCLHIVFEYRKSQSPKRHLYSGRYSHKDETIRLSDRVDCCGNSKEIGWARFIFIMIYVIIKLIYTFSFTFTILYTVLLVIYKANSGTVGPFVNIQQQVFNISQALSFQVENFAEAELRKHIKLVQNSEEACSAYSQDVMINMWQGINTILKDDNMELMYGNTSIGAQMSEMYERHFRSYETQVDAYKNRKIHVFYNDTFIPMIADYKRYLREIYSNDWFLYPQNLFNISDERHLLDEQETEVPFERKPLEFANFLDIEEASGVAHTAINFWERYQRNFPELKPIPIPRLETPLCDRPSHVARMLESTHFSYNNLTNSTFFFMQDGTEEVSVQNYDKSSDYSFYLQYFHKRILQDMKLHSIFDADESVWEIRDIDWHIYKSIFLLLDIVLILYRLSHIYVTIQHLCFGFEEFVFVNTDTRRGHGYKPDGAYNASIVENLPLESSLNSSFNTATSIDSGTASLQPMGAKNTQPNGSAITIGSLQGKVTKHAKLCTVENRGITRMKSICSIYSNKLMHSSLVPKFIILTVILFAMYCILVSCKTSWVRFVNVSGVISHVYSSLRVHIEFTNIFLKQQAKSTAQGVAFLYSRLSQPILQELEGLVRFVNTGQSMKASRFVNETCSVLGSYSNSSTCGVTVRPPLLQIPILPCNTVPLKTPVFHFHEEELEAGIMQHFTHFLSTAQTIVISVIVCLLVCILIAVFLCALDTLVLQYIRTRRVFPVKTLYMVPMKYYPTSGIFRTSGVHTSASSRSKEDLELESTAELHTRLSSKKQVQFSPIRATVTVPRTDALVSDLGFSETKV